MDQQPQVVALAQQPQSSVSKFQDLRNQKYDYQIKHKQDVPKYKHLQHELLALITTKALILGPLERMKIVLQVKPLAQFINPKDKPKNALDLFNKIGNDQGLLAYFRGINAFVYKLILQNTIKFGLYETVFQSLNHSRNNPEFSVINSIGAATLTGVLTTTLTYPLDFAHGRMSADMSKKPSVYIERSDTVKQQSRLYSSVRDCLSKAQYEKGLSKTSRITNIFRGYQSALVGQVPYTIILMSTFEALEKFNQSEATKFNSKKDNTAFIYKLFNRFGASTLSLILAQTLCYPFDTVKRRMQLNGSIGHKNIYKNDFDCFRRVVKDEGIVKGLYSGFSVNLVRCFPLVIIQYTVFRAYRNLSQKKEIYQRREFGPATFNTQSKQQQ
eukprot:403342489